MPADHDSCRGLSPLAALFFLFLAACAPGTRTVVHEGLFQLSADKQVLYDLVPEQAIEEAANDLARGLLAGSMDTLSDDERQAQVRGLVANFVGAVEEELKKAGIAELGPKAHDTVVSTVEDSVAVALSSGTRLSATRLARALSRATAETLMETATTGWEEKLGPALATSFQKDFGPALQQALRVNITPEVALMARSSGRELLNGASESLDGPLGDALDKRLFSPLNSALKEGQATAGRWIVFLVVALVVLVVVLTGIAVYFGGVWRRELGKSRTRQGTICLLTEAISNATRQGTIEELLNELKRLRTHSDRADAYAELERTLGEFAHHRLQRRDGDPATRLP